MDVKAHANKNFTTGNHTARTIRSGVRQFTGRVYAFAQGGAQFDIAQRFNDYSGRVSGILFKAMSCAVLVVLAAVVLTALSLIGWLYGVWQNRRLSGMPLAVVSTIIAQKQPRDF